MLDISLLHHMGEERLDSHPFLLGSIAQPWYAFYLWLPIPSPVLTLVIHSQLQHDDRLVQASDNPHFCPGQASNKYGLPYQYRPELPHHWPHHVQNLATIRPLSLGRALCRRVW